MENKLTFAQIVAKMGELGIDSKELDQFPYMGNREGFDEAFGKVEEIADAATGGEDEGSDYRRVYFFADHDVYVAIDGYYASYDGTEYTSGFTQVVPAEETHTVYNEV